MKLYDEIFHWVYLSSYPPIINKIACCQRLLKWDLAQQVTDEKKQTMPRAYDNMPHGQERLRQEEEGKLPKLLLNSCFARKDGQEQESAPLAWHYFCHPIFCPSSLDSLQKSFLVNVGELFEHATAKKDDGESIIN